MAKFDTARLAPLASPLFTGDPRATATPAPGDNDTSLATTAFVAAAVLAGGGGGASITVSDTPPGSPAVGAMWWESDTGSLWIFYNDGNTSQWVAIAGSMTTAAPAGTAPTRQVFLSGSGTYTKPALCKWIEVEMCGGGAGGSSANANGSAGGNTTFGPLTAGGAPASPTAGYAAGGTASGGQINLSGGWGQGGDLGNTNAASTAGGGGVNPFGGAGSSYYAGAGQPGINGTGAGGGGGSLQVASLTVSGVGGGAGGYVKHIFGAPAATYPYAVGVGGAGSPGQGGQHGAGGKGGDGIIIVTEYY